MGSNVTFKEQIEKLNLDLTESQAKTDELMKASKIGGTFGEEDIDLERDPNQQSIMTRSELGKKEKKPDDEA